MQEHALKAEHAAVVAIGQHAGSVALAAVDLPAGETRGTRLSGCPAAEQIAGWAEAWATKPIRFVYESGPCGSRLRRDVRALGHSCDMIAVPGIPRSADDRALKDDRRDARSLPGAVTAPKSRCRAVYVPDEGAEGARDAVRAYFDQVRATKALKLQTSGMLLRHGHVWNERTPAGNLRATWTAGHLAWARGVRLADPTAQKTLKSYIASTVSATGGRAETRRGLAEICGQAGRAVAQPRAPDLAGLGVARPHRDAAAVDVHPYLGDIPAHRRPPHIAVRKQKPGTPRILARGNPVCNRKTAGRSM